MHLSLMALKLPNPHFIYMWKLPNKTERATQIQRGGWPAPAKGGLGAGEGTEEARSAVMSHLGDVKHSIGIIISRIVISVGGAGWVPHGLGGPPGNLYKHPTTMLYP